jgi:hypothetical protein
VETGLSSRSRGRLSVPHLPVFSLSQRKAIR